MSDKQGDSEPAVDEPTSNSRRWFLTGSAGTIGGLALGSAFVTQSAFGDEHTGDGEPAEMGEDEFEDDIDILNYALTLEFLEAKFYEEGLENIGEDELLNATPLCAFGDQIQSRVYGDLQTIRDHERTHADTIESVIGDLGGEPVDEPEFDFGSAVEDPTEFIATGAQLEDTGVSAYAGAAPFIEDEELVPPALSIHSVEARHASFLRVLNDEIGFPAAFDEPRSKSEVLDIASAFIVDGGDNG